MGRPFFFRAACVVAAAGLCATTLVAQVPAGKRAAAAASAERASRASRAFDLGAAAGGMRAVNLTAGRVMCAINNFGNQCNDLYYYAEGGFWPRGTFDNYVYNGGLQIAGLISRGAGFAWAGDTVGVYFMDTQGSQREGAAVTNVYNSLNANDLAVWPTAAYANDPALFGPSLLGRAAISDQDTWVRYWDGDPWLSGGRQHMMGVVVDQRTLSWNRPNHQDIIYLLFRVINITSRLPSSYAGLTSIGYSAADQEQLAALGAQFQASAESLNTSLQIPDSGYTFENLYVAYTQDPDVGNASFNFATAVLPFSLVAAMKSNYSEPQWIYPPDIFSGAFAPAPGFEAIELLRGAADSGGGRTRIAVWSNTTFTYAGFYPPIGTSQLYRYLSGRPVGALGDGQCNSDPILLHTCAAVQAPTDTRYYESTGPATLAPGQSLLVAVAAVFAAPVAQWAATTNGSYALPAGQLATYEAGGSYPADQTFYPGWPATAETLAVVGTAGGTRVCTTGCDKTAIIREPVERAMGWGQFSDANGDGRIEASEVQTVPGSLLHKAQVAQALFDDKFLLPAAPDAPRFFLVPGDNAVTIAWERSATETSGDPYYPVSQDPTSPLYDPDYRQNDVVGYRIWRGTSPASLQVVAEFDYTGRSFTDYTGQFVNTYYYGNQCAPELGVTTSCPTFPVQLPLYGDVVQVPVGGRILAQNGAIVVLRADTVHLQGYGDPQFVFADSSVKNGFTYYYAVTAFDLNSVRSGPSSLESPLAPKMVTPRVGSGQESAGAVGAPVLLGADGAVLAGTVPTLDSLTGEFSGPMPPATGIGLGLIGFLPQVMDSGSVTVTIDSIQPGDGWIGRSGTYFYTVQSALGTLHRTASVLVDLSSSMGSATEAFPAVRADPAKVSRYGGDSAFATGGSLQLQWVGTWDITNWGRGAANGYPYDNLGYQGPRWWVGSANENTSNPNGGKCGVQYAYSCDTYQTPATLARTAGSLGAGTQVMAIEAYGTVPTTPMRQVHAMTSYLARAADFKVYWGTGGAVDSVVDVTHHVPVPFSPVLRASWGLLTDQSFAATNAALTPDQSNAVLRWDDVMCIAPIPTLLVGGSLTAAQGCGGAAQTPAVLMQTAHLSPVVFGSSAFAAPTSASTGNGFIFYLAGQFFLVQRSVLPAPGTVWNLRTYAGSVLGSPGSFTYAPPGFYGPCYYACTPLLPPAVPGLRVRLGYTGSTFTPLVSNAAELAAVHTVPDPYYNHDAFEASGAPRQIHFVNLPARCIIRIYSASGILVRVLTHNDPTGGGEAVWDVTNRGGGLVASGVYFYHVEAPDGKTKIGRLTIVTMTAN